MMFDINRLEELVSLVSVSNGARGMALGVVDRGGNVLLERCYGYRDLDGRLPVDRDTVFGLASVTKSFTIPRTEGRARSVAGRIYSIFIAPAASIHASFRARLESTFSKLPFDRVLFPEPSAVFRASFIIARTIFKKTRTKTTRSMRPCIKNSIAAFSRIPRENTKKPSREKEGFSG